MCHAKYSKEFICICLEVWAAEKCKYKNKISLATNTSLSRGCDLAIKPFKFTVLLT